VDTGASVVRVAAGADGRVDLSEAFRRLSEHGIQSVMVEGGAEVITRVLQGFFADQLVLTVARTILGGVHAVGTMLDTPLELRPRLNGVAIEMLGGDLVLHGEFERSSP
jgi:riboflavin biosynthesis pyrimidine reductase